ncbi:hypothetical protein [Candidatus Pantoea persica]|uniref:hypothetical protein n=1 Tax=Candidatus Pantoea persica TaxID=2518128 RepID=UPI00215D9DDB|nr:hypothetical protein [Candidatus Pantoea persica]MBA2813988.1 esterase [Candidatus Pantoea persica]
MASLNAADRQLVATLRDKGVRVSEIRFPGQTHGQLLPSSLDATLEVVASF